MQFVIRHNKSLLFCFLPTAVPLALAVPLHGVSIATVAVHVKLNEPALLNVARLPSMSALMTSLNKCVDEAGLEVQISTSPTANVPPDGVIVTSGGQSVHKGA